MIRDGRFKKKKSKSRWRKMFGKLTDCETLHNRPWLSAAVSCPPFYSCSFLHSYPPRCISVSPSTFPLLTLLYVALPSISILWCYFSSPSVSQHKHGWTQRLTSNPVITLLIIWIGNTFDLSSTAVTVLAEAAVKSQCFQKDDQYMDKTAMTNGWCLCVAF